MITLGGIALAMAVIRVFVFKLPESPRYLLSKGRDAEAVDVVNYIARYNGKPETLSLDMLMAIDDIHPGHIVKPREATVSQAATGPKRRSYKAIIKDNFKDFSPHSYRKLFAGRKMAQHSSVSFLIWLTIGIAYPLYFAFITSYLETKASYSVNDSLNYTYKVYCIVSVVGVLGPIAAGFCVETRLGRRWMMALSSVLTGVFLFAYTAIGTQAGDIGFQCATAILGNFGKQDPRDPPPIFPGSLDLDVFGSLSGLAGEMLIMTSHRIRHYVCIYTRIVPGSCPRHRYWNCRDAFASGRTGGFVYLDVCWIFRGAYLRERCALDSCGVLLHWPAL